MFGHTLFVIWISFLLVLLLAAVNGNEKDKVREAAAKQPQTILGELRDAEHSEQSGVTTIILTDETRIRVEGAYPVVKPGMPVTTPNGVDLKRRLYCLNDRCLFEKED